MIVFLNTSYPMLIYYLRHDNYLFAKLAIAKLQLMLSAFGWGKTKLKSLIRLTSSFNSE